MGEYGSSVRTWSMGRTRSMVIVLLVVLSGAMVMLVSEKGSEGLDVGGGNITGDVTWGLSDSPVKVMGNISVEAGATLRVMPGVIVMITEGCYIEVVGRLVAVGTDNNPIGMGSMTTFDRINVTQGGNATLDHVLLLGSQRGIFVDSAGSILRVYNSSIQSSGSGITAQTGAEAWVVSCIFDAIRNVSVSNAKVHEGNWLFFRAFRDDNLKGYPGVELEVTATKPQAYTWTIFDSKKGDPDTDSDGKLPPIIVEQYLHEGSSSGSRVNFQLRMWEKNWFHTEYPLYMGKDMYFNWSLDLTPPSPPFNLSVRERGDHWLFLDWEIGSVTDLKEFNLTYKMDWQAEKDFSTISVPNTLRSYNLTGLLEEMTYDIKINALDFGENPSTYFGPIKARTLDRTAPDPPQDLRLLEVGGTWAAIQWDESPSFDVLGYMIFRNGSGEGKVGLMEVVGRTKVDANVTGLASETDYTLWVAAYDDAEDPNLSNWNASLEVRTRDITPPEAPELSLWFVDPVQYKPGSMYYNGTNVGLKGGVSGEDRDFVDVLVNDVPYVLPEGVSRFTTDKGNFSFFVQLPEGLSNLRVRAVDPSGNTGQLSEERSVVIDLTSPALSIWQKGSPTLIVDKDTEFVLNCTATDENGLDDITWTIEGQSTSLERDGESIQIDLPIGEYIAVCKATDLAGNIAVASLRVSSMVPDLTPPAVVSSYPTNGSIVDQDIEMWVKFSEAIDWSDLEVRLEEAQDASAVIGIEMVFDEVNLTVIVRLLENLEDSTSYRLTLKSIIDMRGNEAKDLVIGFSTKDKESIDSDGDGIPDYFEVLHISFLSPSDPSDAAMDKDKDGLTNLAEYRLGTDLEDPDTDKDEMDDGWEVKFGLDPLSNSDAMQDLDGDGFTNLDEYKAGTDPTDGTDYPGSDGTDKVPSWLIILIVVIVLLLIGIIVWSVVAFSRKRRGEEEGSDRSDAEGLEDLSEGPTYSVSDECPECGAPLDEGSGVCPVCGKVRGPTEDSPGEEVMTGPTTGVGPEQPIGSVEGPSPPEE